MAKSLNVYLRFDETDPAHVGRLVWDDATARAVFRYEPDYLRQGLEISPLLLPLSTQTYSGAERVADRDRDVFLGLPPVFSDSIPDRWGRAILDAALAKRGIGSPTAMDYLGMLGHRAMGALVYEPAVEEADNERLSQARSLYEEAYRFIQGDASVVASDLREIGGSAGGMRPKVLVGYDPESNRIWRGLRKMPPGFRPALMKLPIDSSGNEASAYMRIEYAYHRMARAAGLEVAPAYLIEAEGQAYFLVERFDWDRKRRYHMHSLGALIGRNFNDLDYDYDQLLRVVLRLTRDRSQVAKAFRQAVFNVYAVNWDDHVKNFAFLMDQTGEWRLSPAFDVTYSTGRDGQPSTAVTGKRKGISDADFLALAKTHSVNRAQRIIDEVRAGIDRFPEFAARAGVPDERVRKIRRLMS